MLKVPETNMQIEALEKHYSKILESLPREPSKAPFNFNATEWQDSPEKPSTDNIKIEKRSSYRPFGTFDSVVIKLGKNTTRSLGLHLISLAFSMKKNQKSILLNNPESNLALLILRKPHSNTSKRLNVMLTEYYYVAKNPQDFDRFSWSLQEESDELSHSLSINLVDEQGDYAAPFENRNILNISGSCSGLILLGEYLLNLGLQTSKTNYINFSNTQTFNQPISSDDINVDDDSCFGRFEILAEQNNV